MDRSDQSAHRDPAHDLPRDETPSAAVERRRREAGISDHNALSAAEAVAAIRAIRARAIQHLHPDSTTAIRADRDSR